MMLVAGNEIALKRVINDKRRYAAIAVAKVEVEVGCLEVREGRELEEKKWAWAHGRDAL